MFHAGRLGGRKRFIDEARGENHLHGQLLFDPALVVRESGMVRRPLTSRREGTA
jgi:hypothetical protein